VSKTINRLDLVLNCLLLRRFSNQTR